MENERLSNEISSRNATISDECIIASVHPTLTFFRVLCCCCCFYGIALHACTNCETRNRHKQACTYGIRALATHTHTLSNVNN